MITSFQYLSLDDKVLGNDLLELIIFCNALSEGRTCLIEDFLKIFIALSFPSDLTKS